MSDTVPSHLGLILDGNRRWATEQGLPTLEGHRKGYENLKTIGKAAIKRGVKFVSAYVFSTENWNRSAEEVEYLMKLLVWVATKEIKDLDEAGIRVVFAGSRAKLKPKVIKAIESAEKRTAQNTGGTLALCLNYGGHQEIIDAVNQAIADGHKTVTKTVIEHNLYAAEIPPIDLVIRTSGEQRISNFMLWRVAYSELLFVKKHWPAFTEADLDNAFAEYSARQRRFGA